MKKKEIQSIIHLSKEIKDSLIKGLLDRLPEEGCALLLGETNHKNNNNILQITEIWFCRNVWSSTLEQFINNSDSTTKYENSRKNRFLIDPLELVKVQKWARNNQFVIIGSAHSHPTTKAIPSQLDIKYSHADSIMIIVDSVKNIRAWQMPSKRTTAPIELTVIT